MMQDIGLHLNINKLVQLEKLTPSEIEMRKRLYNSAFIWDKTLSLALGRLPSLLHTPYGDGDISQYLLILLRLSCLTPRGGKSFDQLQWITLTTRDSGVQRMHPIWVNRYTNLCQRTILRPSWHFVVSMRYRNSANSSRPFAADLLVFCYVDYGPNDSPVPRKWSC